MGSKRFLSMGAAVVATGGLQSDRLHPRRRAALLWLAATGFALVLAATSPARAQGCPNTVGGAFIDATRAWLTQGDMQDITSPVPPAGMQMRLHWRAAPPPNGAFFKLPTGVDFGIPGADQYNRIPIPEASLDATDAIHVRLNDFRATKLEQFDFTCQRDFMGQDLSGGALRADLHFEPRRIDEAIQIVFKSPRIRIALPPICVPYPVIRFNRFGIPVVRWRQACSPELTLFNDRIQFELQDLDMPGFTVKVAVVPEVRGDSIYLRAIVDAREVSAAVPFASAIDAIATSMIRVAEIICIPALVVGPGQFLSCIRQFENAVDVYEQWVSVRAQIELFVSDQVKSSLEFFNSNATGGNHFVRKFGNWTEERIQSVDLPKLIREFNTPDFDVVEFNPFEIPKECNN
jgi:hypothetical protein